MPQDHAVITTELRASLLQELTDAVPSSAVIVEELIPNHQETAGIVCRHPAEILPGVESIRIFQSLLRLPTPLRKERTELGPALWIRGRLNHIRLRLEPPFKLACKHTPWRERSARRKSGCPAQQITSGYHCPGWDPGQSQARFHVELKRVHGQSSWQGFSQSMGRQSALRLLAQTLSSLGGDLAARVTPLIARRTPFNRRKRCGGTTTICRPECQLPHSNRVIGTGFPGRRSSCQGQPRYKASSAVRTTASQRAE